MQQRFLYIYFPYLLTDQLKLRKPDLGNHPLVLVMAQRGRRIIYALNAEAAKQGIRKGIPEADAKAIVPGLIMEEQQPGKENRLLKAIGEWCIRYSPLVALDLQDGLYINCSGCTHLWGEEQDYIKEIRGRLAFKGYEVRTAIADTMTAARAVARFGKNESIVTSGQQAEALLALPPDALQLEEDVLQRLHKLGFSRIGSFLNIQRQVLRRRFGENLLTQLARALGKEQEIFRALVVPEPYHERLPSPEPIRTATGIEIGIRKLLESMCHRLRGESKGIRHATMKCYRVDGKVLQVEIGTNIATAHAEHLFKLFELRISDIKPGLGIELFTLDATQVEELLPGQELLWNQKPGLDDLQVAELLDRIAVKMGKTAIHRYLPQEHYWPERSIKKAVSLLEETDTPWHLPRPRPTRLLSRPLLIDVTAPIPDYPPMLFRLKDEIHTIKRADGPERIEREWWLEQGEHRDYYQVEDQDGKRYWIFRLGHYRASQSAQWFIHGYFA